MPTIRVSSRYQRHFSPLTVRTAFKRELYHRHPPIAYRTIYPLGHNVPKQCSSDPFTTDPAAHEAGSTVALIPKPGGEVSRLDRGGYNLEEKLAELLEWTENEYQTFQVSHESYSPIC